MTIEKEAELRAPQRSRWAVSPLGAVCAAVALFWIGIAIFAPWVAPYPAGRIVSPETLAPMSGAFPLGTDYLGRDMLSRIILGSRYTVGVPLAAAVLAVSAGVTLGMAAAVFGGWFDAILSRVVDAFIAIPSKMFSLLVVAALGTSLPVLIGMLAFIYTPGSYRIARSLAVNVNELDFVIVARARGERTFYLIREEIFPNIVGPVLADFGLRFVFIVLLLSGLSFLGLGVQPPNADWGALVRENLAGLPYGAPAVIFPSVAIASLTIAVNLGIDNLPYRRSDGEP